ncbi:ABC transporter permease [Actinomadura monticuli]|uniref:ABC transporter permease n=1 Tax=Actinomadura monticuli TaxID=3097367 RepID=A0ABV4Q4M9_9ACTN
MTHAFRLVGQTVMLGLAEIREIYTWRSWTFGWLARLLCQASFFALIGRYVGDTDTMRFVLIGNIVALACLESTIVVISLAGERRTGTLALLAVAPGSHLPLYLGRGLHWVVTGLTSTLVAWLTLPPLLGVPLPWPEAALALPLIVLIAVTSYGYGCLLGALALRLLGFEWLILNVGYGIVLTFCGVNVTLSTWPEPLRWFLAFLPVTHGLQAIRTVLAAGPAADIFHQAGLELLVGIGWFALAALLTERLVGAGRRNATLEFND